MLSRIILKSTFPPRSIQLRPTLQPPITLVRCKPTGRGLGTSIGSTMSEAAMMVTEDKVDDGVYVAVDDDSEAPVDVPEAERTPPEGFVLHTESTTSILFAVPKDHTGPAPVFLNPVQQYNRDLSVVAIRTWAENRQRAKAAAWEAGVRKKWKKEEGKRKVRDGEEQEEGAKKRKGEDGEPVPVEKAPDAEQAPPKEPEPKAERVLRPPTYKFTLLEALSATGLRAIRYAKELPLLKYVVANDLSSSAVDDIRRNIEWNGLSPKGLPAASAASASETDPPPPPPPPTTKPLSKAEVEELTLGKVRVNEGDACVYMYMHRTEATKFDCVDLDPYGSAVPFLDAAIGAVADGGLLCVTCTDAGVLAGHNYPEKAYTHYGGVCVNTEYSHEVGIRLVLNAIAATAGRYGRTIEPLLSLSIDFYMRVFVRITTSPKEVKSLPSKTSLVYFCHDCQAPHLQPMGRVVEKTTAKGDVNYTYHSPSGPPPGVGERCGECGGKFHVGGPMWSAPIHDQAFVQEMLEHVRENEKDFGTSARIFGMLSVAKSELAASPFYFTPVRLCGLFHCQAPPLATVASALLNGGFKVSRSHASPGSIKTDAPREFCMDIIREWIKINPVKMENVKAGSPAARLLAKEQKATVSLAHHPEAEAALMSKVKLVRYQVNPVANWGPAKAAVKGGGNKKKADEA